MGFETDLESRWRINAATFARIGGEMTRRSANDKVASCLGSTPKSEEECHEKQGQHVKTTMNRIRRPDLYVHEVDAKNAGDLNCNVMEKGYLRRNSMRTPLAVTWGKDDWVEQLAAKREGVTKETAARDVISGMEEDQDRWKMVLHATAAENEAQEFRRGMIAECKRVGRLELYAREANKNDAGDLNWDVMEKVNRRMEWMRTELGVNWAIEVGELRLGTPGDLNSTARLALGYRRDEQQTAMQVGEYSADGGDDDVRKRTDGPRHRPNFASLEGEIHHERQGVRLVGIWRVRAQRVPMSRTELGAKPMGASTSAYEAAVGSTLGFGFEPGLRDGWIGCIRRRRRGRS
ncbi:hypothetical protein K438DRAFT_1945467 [Mycena galopus ATCC 62051]|nr:hypothetical protein K438DRAFT_1945467 [Mycena galopus ATCC 62051]